MYVYSRNCAHLRWMIYMYHGVISLHVYSWHRYLFISDSNFPINVIVSFLVQIEQGYQTIFFFLCILVVPENYSYLSHRRDFFPLEIPISCKVYFYTFLFNMFLVLQDPLPSSPRKFQSLLCGGWGAWIFPGTACL